MKKTIGIIGGLGPQTTAELYFYLTKKSRELSNEYPSIIIDSVSFPFILEKEIMKDMKNGKLLVPYIIESINRLNDHCDFMMMACNTMHLFFDDLKKASKVPMLNVVDETVNIIKKKGYKKVGLLASTRTIKSRLYEVPLSKNQINIVKLSEDEQEELQNIILRILADESDNNDKGYTKNLISDLKRRGAQAIVLACTDLQLIIKNGHKVEIIDSMKVLADAAYKKLIA